MNAQNSGTNYPYTGRIALDNVSLTPVTMQFQNFTADGTTICKGSNATLTVAGVPGYTWLPSGTVNMSISVSPTVTTCYTVRASDTNSCTAQKTVCVNVLPCAGVDELSVFSDLTLVPNPASCQLKIIDTPVYLTNYRVFGLSGRQLLGGELSGSYEIDISGLENGLYVISCSGTSGTIHRHFLVQR